MLGLYLCSDWNSADYAVDWFSRASILSHAVEQSEDSCYGCIVHGM